MCHDKTAWDRICTHLCSPYRCKTALPSGDVHRSDGTGEAELRSAAPCALLARLARAATHAPRYYFARQLGHRLAIYDSQILDALLRTSFQVDLINAGTVRASTLKAHYRERCTRAHGNTARLLATRVARDRREARKPALRPAVL